MYGQYREFPYTFSKHRNSHLVRFYSHSTAVSINVLYLFQDPVQDAALHSVVQSFPACGIFSVFSYFLQHWYFWRLLVRYFVWSDVLSCLDQGSGFQGRIQLRWNEISTMASSWLLTGDAHCGLVKGVPSRTHHRKVTVLPFPYFISLKTDINSSSHWGVEEGGISNNLWTYAKNTSEINKNLGEVTLKPNNFIIFKLKLFFFLLTTCLVSLSHVWLFETTWTVARQVCPWDFSGKNTGVGSHFSLQEILDQNVGIEPTFWHKSKYKVENQSLTNFTDKNWNLRDHCVCV